MSSSPDMEALVRRIASIHAKQKLILERVDSLEDELALGLKDGDAQLCKVVTNHESRLHRDYTPDHHEQHSRLSAWFRRIDSILDHVFHALAIFVLLLVGIGLLSLMSNTSSIPYIKQFTPQHTQVVPNSTPTLRGN